MRRMPTPHSVPPHAKHSQDTSRAFATRQTGERVSRSWAPEGIVASFPPGSAPYFFSRVPSDRAIKLSPCTLHNTCEVEPLGCCPCTKKASGAYERQEMSQAGATVPMTAAAAAASPAATFSAPVSAPTPQPTTASPAGSALAASAPPAVAALVAAAPAPAAPPAAGTSLATQYGVVMWPSLPGLQHAAVGVAPPAATPPQLPHHMAAAMGAPAGAAGRGVMLGPGPGPHALPAAGSPPMPGDWGTAAPTPPKARRKPRANSAKKSQPTNEVRTETCFLMTFFLSLCPCESG